MNVASTWNGAHLLPAQVDIQVWSDASQTGWGGWTGHHLASGTWPPEVSAQPSNYRELLAIHKVLQSLDPILQGHTVQVLCDNVTAVAYLNHLGGTNPLMNRLTQTNFVFCQKCDITLQAQYFAGKNNVMADYLSRVLTKFEFSLHPDLFQLLDNMWGAHTVDQFASQEQHLCLHYNSLFLDPQTEGMDALAQDWSGENNFINAPFSLLDKILSKIQRNKCMATVIAPVWKGRVWMQKLWRMLVAPPLWLPNHPGTFLSRKPEPCQNRAWEICSWRLSGARD